MICEDFNLYIVRRFYTLHNHDKESIHDVVGVVVRNLTRNVYTYRGKPVGRFNVDRCVGDLRAQTTRACSRPHSGQNVIPNLGGRPKNVSAIRLSENGYTARIFLETNTGSHEDPRWNPYW
jgi:hypothetical protein